MLGMGFMIWKSGHRRHCREVGISAKVWRRTDSSIGVSWARMLWAGVSVARVNKLGWRRRGLGVKRSGWQVLQGLAGCWKDLSFYSEWDGKPPEDFEQEVTWWDLFFRGIILAAERREWISGRRESNWEVIAITLMRADVSVCTLTYVCFPV